MRHRLHDCRFDAKTEIDIAIVDEIYASTGAVLSGTTYTEDLDPEGSNCGGRARSRHRADPLAIRSGLSCSDLGLADSPCYSARWTHEKGSLGPVAECCDSHGRIDR